MYGIKYHAVRLAFLNHKLSNMVWGSFGTRRGKGVVYISHHPDMPEVSIRKRLIYQLNTKKGQFYSELVKQYLDIKAEYDDLLYQWNANYRIPVPHYDFPINSDLGLHNLDYNHFVNAKAYQNTYKNKNPVEYNGDIFRSKNETYVAKNLKEKKLPYKVEAEIDLDGNDYHTRTPDILFGIEAINRSAYIEVVGGIGLDNYKENNATKILEYEEAGYRDGKDIIMIYLKNDYSEDYINIKINEALELMSPPLPKMDSK